MTHDLRDPVLGLVARLPVAAPSGARSELVRARAHVALEKRRRAETMASKQTAGGRVVDGALYLACVVYVTAAAIEALKCGWPLR
jgi:hypothetical protein